MDVDCRKTLSLEERQPHVVIKAGDKVHVYPVAFFRGIVAGEGNALESIPRDVLRTIIGEWVAIVEERSR